MHGAGRRDAQSHCWVQLSSRHGTDGEAAHRDARADGQCKVEAVLCLGIAARRGNSGAAEYLHGAVALNQGSSDSISVLLPPYGKHIETQDLFANIQDTM